MSRNEKIDPNQPDDKSEKPPSSPRDPIEPDPMNPAPPPGTEPAREERPDLDWAEHED
jgi:hypothetical protein